MSEKSLPALGGTTFEGLKRTNQHGAEYWSARDLQAMLGYSQWRRFEQAIERAITSCKQSGNDPSYHFAGAGKMVELGSSSTRELADYHLSRFACYPVGTGDGAPGVRDAPRRHGPTDRRDRRGPAFHGRGCLPHAPTLAGGNLSLGRGVPASQHEKGRISVRGGKSGAPTHARTRTRGVAKVHALPIQRCRRTSECIRCRSRRVDSDSSVSRRERALRPPFGNAYGISGAVADAGFWRDTWG